MEKKKAIKAADVAQEPAKEAQRYKITCGTFKDKNEALQSAAEAKVAGVNVVLTIGAAGYSLLYAENMTKAAADAARKEIEAKKIIAEVSEQ